jgi:hypothetical protein
MRVPARIDLQVWQNANLETRYVIFENGVPYDLTGLTGSAIKAQVRAEPGQTGTPLATSDLTSGMVIVDATQGVVAHNIVQATLAAIGIPNKFEPLELYWDLIITPASGLAFVAIEGRFLLNAGVTR